MAVQPVLITHAIWIEEEIYSETKMYTAWSFDDVRKKLPKAKSANDGAYLERERRVVAEKVVDSFASDLNYTDMPISSSEVLSEFFRQRGIPCMDSFTFTQLSSFRRAIGLTTPPEGTTRKFLTVTSWSSPSVTTTLWTVEPVISTTLIKGNSINVREAMESYDPSDLVIDPIGSSVSTPAVVADNSLMGRWASWVVWRASIDKSWSDAVCLNTNMSSFALFFTMHIKDGKMIDLVMTPESVSMLGGYATNMIPILDVSAVVSSSKSTKLLIQPAVHDRTASVVKVFGNGSLQFCGSPDDIEHLFTALFRIIKTVMKSEAVTFLSTMRLADTPVV